MTLRATCLSLNRPWLRAKNTVRSPRCPRRIIWRRWLWSLSRPVRARFTAWCPGPRHPTTWHVRDYGLFAANPFGLRHFEKKPKGAGNLKIEAGKSVTFAYRFYIHEGDTEAAKVEQRYGQWAAGGE